MACHNADVSAMHEGLPAGGELWPLRSKLQEICPGLYITNFFGAQKKLQLQEHSISHVVVCAREFEPAFPADFEYKKLDIADNTTVDLNPHIRNALPWISKAIHSGGRVLVHCAAGSSRSGAIAIAYRMWTKGETYEASRAHACSVRPIVQPNLGFEEQLKALGASQFALLQDGIVDGDMS